MEKVGYVDLFSIFAPLALVAQLDRVSASEVEGHAFDHLQGERSGQTCLSISEPKGGYLNRRFKYNRIKGLDRSGSGCWEKFFLLLVRVCPCSSVG